MYVLCQEAIVTEHQLQLGLSRKKEHRRKLVIFIIRNSKNASKN